MHIRLFNEGDFVHCVSKKDENLYTPVHYSTHNGSATVSDLIDQNFFQFRIK